MERIVLAYSGGLDESIAIQWLAETFSAEVVTVTLDLGHGAELVEIRQRALALGAVRSHVIDVREEFVRDYALPALQAGALYADRAPMTTALTRPLIARKLVDVARMENATAVAHGCAATSDDGLRLDALVSALDPALRVIAPTRMWDMTREEALAFASERGLPVPALVRRSLQDGLERVGPHDDLLAGPGLLGGALGGHLRADQVSPRLPRPTRLRRDRVRGRARRCA